jgi:hypothetical protein
MAGMQDAASTQLASAFHQLRPRNAPAYRQRPATTSRGRHGDTHAFGGMQATESVNMRRCTQAASGRTFIPWFHCPSRMAWFVS